MSTGLISDLLNIQPQTSTPAGSMQVKMLPCEYIMRNPDNKIYVVGDIDKLKEDIRLNGVRQPLEVIRWAKLYDHLRTEDGRVPVVALSDALGELMESFRAGKNSSSSPA